MKTHKGGFTLIEVALFLAITGLLFLGVTIGVQNSIFQQRYNDSVQSFVEFLRGAYAKVENVQGRSIEEGSGNTNKALYGKLITFGEKLNLTKTTNDNDTVFMYDIVGDAKCNTGGFQDAITMLKDSCHADVLGAIDSGGNRQLLGLAESYTPKWSAAIQSTAKNKELFKGSIIITRHPQTGTLNTYAAQGRTVEVNNNQTLKQFLEANVGAFKNSENVDFCINPNGNEISPVRADVRIKAGARNTSGIEIIPDDDNQCADRG